MSPAQVCRNQPAAPQTFAKLEVLRIETNSGKGGNGKKQQTS